MESFIILTIVCDIIFIKKFLITSTGIRKTIQPAAVAITQKYSCMNTSHRAYIMIERGKTLLLLNILVLNLYLNLYPPNK